jgi:GDPmannose 4,6-dehydratase
MIELSFSKVGIPIEWRGEGIEEKGIDARDGRVIIEIDPVYFRPTEVDTLWGDPTKARTKLGWACKTSFAELVDEMVSADLIAAQRDALVRKEGFDVYQSAEEGR